MHGQGNALKPVPDAPSPAHVAAYLTRIGLAAVPSPDAQGLARLHWAHRLAIPFENLDVMLGRGIDLSLDAVLAKLVHGGRGGYCFEHGTLFLAMLQTLGFVARPLLARVWLGAPVEVPPRTHMLLAITLDGQDWIADVGFGGGQTLPLPLRDGAEGETPDGARHRLTRAVRVDDPDGTWLLERIGPAEATDGRTTVSDRWQPQYSFAERGVVAADIAQANHWTATRPDTRFTTLHIASRPLPTGFAALTDRVLTRHAYGETQQRVATDAEDWRTMLAATFGIDLSAEDVARLPLFTKG